MVMMMMMMMMMVMVMMVMMMVMMMMVMMVMVVVVVAGWSHIALHTLLHHPNSMEEFWSLDLSLEPFVIVKATIPNDMPPPQPPPQHARTLPEAVTKAEGGTVVARSFRVAQRAANAHAHTNAAFVVRLAPPPVAGSPYPMCHDARLVFAGVSKVRFRFACLSWMYG
jgi:hypothetical protein